MAIYNKPDENVFASSARQGEVSNFPDIGRGWGISFDQTGGIPPMEWFNFLFKRTDEKFGYLFQRGLSEWSATQTYPDGALVQYKNLTYKAKRANTNKKPDEAQSSDWQRWGFTQSELKSATLTESGITQLLTSINSSDETKSATPKSVKMAYDKGVEAKTAADAAQTSANAAQRTANDGVSKANAAQTSANAAQRTANDGVSKANAAQASANAAQRTANDGVSKANAAQASANNANDNANGRVSKSGDSLTGILRSVGIASKQFGIGVYSEQYDSGAPFMVEETGSKDRDTYHPFVKGRVRSNNHYGTAFSFGYTTKQGAGDGFGRGIINLVEDNGKTRIWGFEHNGEFRSAGDVITSSGKSLNTAVQLSDYRSQWGATGWVKLPNGLILQWGKTPVIHDESSKEIVFPIAFPNKVLNIQLTENQMRTVEANATHLAALNVTNTKFTFKMNSTLPIDTSADWFAIGY